MTKCLKGILCQCIVLMVWVGLSQAAEEKKATPVIEVEKPLHDFQQVTEGETIKHDFLVFNRGKAPLEIKSVKPG